MKQPITIFDRETGRIWGHRRVDFGTEAILLPPDRDWTHGRFDDGAWRIDPTTGEAAALEPMAVAVSQNLVSGIPAGTKARVGINTVPELIDDGTLELEAEYPELVDVTLTHPLYLPWEGQVPCGPV